MIICPYCDAENIEGTDACETCEQPLADLHLYTPATELEKSLLRDRIRVLARKSVVTVPPDTPTGDVLKLLVERKIGSVFVVQDGQMVGVFSERDALMRLNADARNHRDEPISNFMTANPQTLDEAARLVYAIRMMDVGGYRHIPIVDEMGQAQTVLSVRDILRYFHEKMAIA